MPCREEGAVVDGAVLAFFDKHAQALPIYEKLEKSVYEKVPGVTVKVQKSQISFYNRHLFACAWFARVRKKQDCPDVYLVVTIGLGHRLDSPRVDLAAEPYPNRWTHHVLLAAPDEVDDELMAWICEAAAFSDSKR